MDKTEQGLKKTKDTWFRRLAKLFDRPAIEESLWEELEEVLIGADTGVGTATTLIERVRERVKKEKVKDAPQARAILQEEMVHLLEVRNGAGTSTLPLVILVVGVNGTGKTTSIAKLAHLYREQKKRVILAAADTFRAAAIEQLRIWGQRAGVEVIAHQSGADPAAVVFDALEAARARKADVVIIDTAGRLHTKFNLMEELKKVRRVVNRFDGTAPHQVLLVIDATTGQNGLNQARSFTEAVGVTGIFLAKLDGTAKGGIVLAISRELGIPICYIGTGEGMEDMAPFQPREFVQALFE